MPDMKVEARGLLGLEVGDINLNTPITLVSGRNNQGKTSLAYAVAAIFAGATNPLSVQKQNFAGYVNKQAKEAKVMLTTDDGARSWVVGKPMKAKGEPPVSHEIAVGLVRPLEMKPGSSALAAVLSEILNPHPALSQVKEALGDILTDEGCQKVYDRIMKSGGGGHSGWDNAKRFYADSRSEVKAQWEYVTKAGRYGANKADTWRPEGFSEVLEKKGVEDAESEYESENSILAGMREAHILDADERAKIKAAYDDVPEETRRLAELEAELGNDRLHLQNLDGSAEAAAKVLSDCRAAMEENRQAFMILDAKNRYDDVRARRQKAEVDADLKENALKEKYEKLYGIAQTERQHAMEEAEASRKTAGGARKSALDSAESAYAEAREIFDEYKNALDVQNQTPPHVCPCCGGGLRLVEDGDVVEIQRHVPLVLSDVQKGILAEEKSGRNFHAEFSAAQAAYDAALSAAEAAHGDELRRIDAIVAAAETKEDDAGKALAGARAELRVMRDNASSLKAEEQEVAELAEKAKEVSVRDAGELEEELRGAEERYKLARAKRENLSEDITRRGAQLEARRGELAEIEKRWAEIEKSPLSATAGDLERQERIVAERKADISRISSHLEARKLHHSVIRLSRIVDELDETKDNSLKARVMFGGLDSINKMLEKVCVACGYPVLHLSGDYHFTWGGKEVVFCSQSEKWRAAAIFSLAIAKRTGSAVCVLDGAEILDADNERVMSGVYSKILSLPDNDIKLLVLKTGKGGSWKEVSGSHYVVADGKTERALGDL